MTNRPSQQSGFSLLELLVASAVLLVVLVSLMPLFMRSIVSVNEGREASVGSSFARTKLDELRALPLDRERFVVLPGATELSARWMWDSTNEDWQVIGDMAETTAMWTRRTTVRVFSLSELYGEADGSHRFSRPLPGEAPQRNKHLWELNALLSNERATGALGSSKSVDVTDLRAF